jgi:hypothetical protein
MNNQSLSISLDEQETIIHYDYKEKIVNIYTNRPSCYRNLLKLLGEPDKGNICGADWYIHFSDRKSIRKGTSISVLLMQKTSRK